MKDNEENQGYLCRMVEKFPYFRTIVIGMQPKETWTHTLLKPQKFEFVTTSYGISYWVRHTILTN